MEYSLSLFLTLSIRLSTDFFDPAVQISISPYQQPTSLTQDRHSIVNAIGVCVCCFLTNLYIGISFLGRSSALFRLTALVSHLLIMFTRAPLKRIMSLQKTIGSAYYYNSSVRILVAHATCNERKFLSTG